MPEEKQEEQKPQESKLKKILYAAGCLTITSTLFIPHYFPPKKPEKPKIIKQESGLEYITLQQLDDKGQVRTVTFYKGSENYDLAIKFFKPGYQEPKTAEN